nr:hypothetical protein BaRGS_024781 [Batillaria attramentaria]
MKKPSDQKKATNGTHHTDSDSPDVSSPGSEISDDSDNGNTSDMEKYPHPEAFFSERDLLGLSSASSSHDASQHSAALSYLAGELRLNHQSKDDSQDSLHSFQQSEPEDSKMGTSGSERPMDSESQSVKTTVLAGLGRRLLQDLPTGVRTTIHGMGRRGIVGEVIYYAPCTKKMKTIPDVMRYLDRHGITDLSRENFTFNTKVNVGQFFEVRDNKVVPLTEVEILERIAMSKGKRARMQMLARKKCEKQLRQQALAKQVMEAKLKRRQEQQVVERQREKEHARIMKQQEKVRQQEQLRLEREMRAQQIIEARRRRQAELEEIRMKEIIRKNKEREMKKQQHLMEKEQERERRRQHLLLVKALEQRKKQEEKQPLPEFPRCPEAKLPGPAFSDCLMIVEFVHNFSDALGLDSDSLPTLEVLQNGLLNANEEDVEEMVTLYLHLLRFALDDLGVPNPKEAMTMLNQKITDLEINDATMSEVTRLFLSAHGEKKMSEWLEKIPLEALNPTKKAAIMAFLVNELLSSKRISGEIEKTLETINTLRRDKWVAEGKLRKLRTVRARKYLKIEHLHQPPPPPSADEDSMTNTTMTSSKAASEDEEEKDEEEEEEEVEESCEESDATHATGNKSEDEDEGLSKEDMDKKIEKLVKQHNSYDSKVADVSKQLRGTCLGHDRYKRLYWILPSTGGIFVEGIESGETEALAYEAELLAKQKAKKEEEMKKKKEDEVEKSEKADSENVKKENTDEQPPSSQKTEGVKTEETNSEKAEVKTEVKETDEGKVVKMEATENSSVKTEDKKLTSASDSVCVKEEKMEGISNDIIVIDINDNSTSSSIDDCCGLLKCSHASDINNHHP